MLRALVAVSVMLCGIGAAAPAVAGLPFDLSSYERVLEERFDDGLAVHDGRRGLWSLETRWNTHVTNAPRSVFLSGRERLGNGQALGLDPFDVRDGVLHVEARPIPADRLAAVRERLMRSGQGRYAAGVRYYTGRLSLEPTWSQTYGYFEAVARIPEGVGLWPAFWLGPATLGWPPEIDVFEAYGRGVRDPAPRDDTFSAAVYFDALDPEGRPAQRVDLRNRFDLDAGGQPRAATAKNRHGARQYVFDRRIDAAAVAGADIYAAYWTYAVHWTPEHIVFYFGKSRDSLVEVFRTPTPDDLHSPMSVILNHQVGTDWGWNPDPAVEAHTLAPGNAFRIASVSIYALPPDPAESAGPAALLDDEPVAARHGLGVARLHERRHAVRWRRGDGNLIVEGYAADDRLLLEGFFFDGADDVRSRLTQVGNDVWLSNGAYPADPQTLVFRDTRVETIRRSTIEVRWSVTPDVWLSSAFVDGAWRTTADDEGVVSAVATGSKLADTDGSDSAPLLLRGGPAGDLFFVYRRGTRVAERAGAGVDTVRTDVDFELPPFVENLDARDASRPVALVGNAVANRLVGGSADDLIRGGAGSDLIDLTAGGPDTVLYRAGDGDDHLVGFGDDDRLVLAGTSIGDFSELQARLVADSGDVVLLLDAGDRITIRGRSVARVSRSQFGFRPGGACRP